MSARVLCHHLDRHESAQLACSNRTLSDANLFLTKRKPFDALAERLVLKNGRPPFESFEPLVQPYIGEFLVPTLQNNVLLGLIDTAVNPDGFGDSADVPA